MGRLVLLVTSPRVAPGLLTADAWRLLAEAEVVLVGQDHPQTPALLEGGIAVSVTEVDSPSAVAAHLEAAAGSTVGTVVWLCAADGDPGLAALLPPTTERVLGSRDLPGARVLDLVAVMDRLRSPGGCPWDAAQTHATLLPYLLEEAYETAEAVETDDRTALREELGDVLLQVAFHSRLAEEDSADPWTIDDVATDIVDKLVSRHPHVFADGSADTAAQVEAGWEAMKRAEKGRTSAVDGVPLAQPALALAAKLMSRADKAGLKVPLPERENLEGLDPEERSSSDEIGDLLLTVVALARDSGVDPEAALRASARRYAQAIKAAEARA